VNVRTVVVASTNLSFATGLLVVPVVLGLWPVPTLAYYSLFVLAAWLVATAETRRLPTFRDLATGVGVVGGGVVLLVPVAVVQSAATGTEPVLRAGRNLLVCGVAGVTLRYWLVRPSYPDALAGLSWTGALARGGRVALAVVLVFGLAAGGSVPLTLRGDGASATDPVSDTTVAVTDSTVTDRVGTYGGDSHEPPPGERVLLVRVEATDGPGDPVPVVTDGHVGRPGRPPVLGLETDDGWVQRTPVDLTNVGASGFSSTAQTLFVGDRRLSHYLEAGPVADGTRVEGWVAFDVPATVERVELRFDVGWRVLVVGVRV
jgi:hypothetical protein